MLAAFFAALSPRRKARVADRAEGVWRNSYGSAAALRGLPADQPVAMHVAPFQVAGVRAGFRYLVFELDSSRSSADAAATDAARLRQWVGACGIGSVLVCSGPSSGRHVWCAPAADTLLPSRLVARIIEAAGLLCPTLDPTPMLNPVSGAVRPPGAPHRSGSHAHLLSHTVSEAIDVLTTGAPLAHFEGLARKLESDAGQATGLEAPADAAPARPPSGGLPRSISARQAVRAIELDDAGHPKLQTGRRVPSKRTLAALTHPLTAAHDHSAWTFSVLLGLVLAGWSFDDVVEIAADDHTSPGLSWLRTTRATGGLRVAHGNTELRRRLTRQWHLAVHAAARLPRSSLDTDPAPAVTRAVAALLDRARIAGESTDRWSRQSGPADYAALLAVALQCLLAARFIIDIDVRRLALLIGYSHETARVALLRLAADGWIAKHAAAIPERRLASSYTIAVDHARHECTGHHRHLCALDPTVGSAGQHGSDTSANAAPGRGAAGSGVSWSKT